MRYVKIVFSKPKNNALPIYSWLIRGFQKTKYSHVSMHFYSESLQRSIIYEAMGKGVRFVGLRIWEQHNEPVAQFKLALTEEQYTEIMRYCIDNSGLDYGLLSAIGLYIANIFKMNSNPLSDNDTKFCSEALAELMFQLGYNIDKPFNLVTPKDIFYYLIKG